MYMNELYIKQMIENGEITLEEIKNLIKVSLEEYPELKSVFNSRKKNLS